MPTAQGDSGIEKELKTLKEELKKKNEKIQRYKRELVNNSVIQRWKIGKYLHDNLVQQLASAKISVNLLRNELSAENLKSACEEITDIIDESIQEVRNLSHDIIPMDVEEEGVGEAFNYLKKRVERRHEVNCKLETDKILHKINRREVATNLYHIAQESIKNAIIHGEARNIKIAIIEHDQQLYLHIKDDGKGFDSADTNTGRGILIMKHRAEEMGGSLRIKDEKKNSDYTTCVTCSLPLKSLEGD